MNEEVRVNLTFTVSEANVIPSLLAVPVVAKTEVQLDDLFRLAQAL